MKAIFVFFIVVGVFAQDVDDSCLASALRAICRKYHGSNVRFCVKWQTAEYEPSDDSFHLKGHRGKFSILSKVNFVKELLLSKYKKRNGSLRVTLTSSFCNSLFNQGKIVNKLLFVKM